MDIKNVLNVALIVISIALIVAILLQQQGAGLGIMFGNTGGESYRSKRGVEKLLFNFTIILTILFVLVGLGIAIVNVKG